MSFAFRSVALPASIPGRLHLHAMPGRHEPLEEFLTAAQKLDAVVCLASRDELTALSPAYAALLAGTTPWTVHHHPIADFGVPRDSETYATLVQQVAGELRSGRRVLVHCGAGVGRCGTFATCVLTALGESFGDALAAVNSGGSRPETDEQFTLAKRLTQRWKAS